MAAGYSRIRIFNPFGGLIAEIEAATKRSWVINDYGRCQFTVPTIDALHGGANTQINGNILNYGNLIYIEHKPSQNQDGSFNGILPPWCGVIMPPRTWNYGQLQVTAYGAEFELFLRTTLINDTLNGSPGQQFIGLVNYANNWQVNFNDYLLPINLGAVDQSGPAGTVTMHGASCYDEIKNLATTTGYEWNMASFVDQNNHLTLTANWFVQQGINVGRVLSNIDMQASQPLYTEQGNIWNTVRSFAPFTAQGNTNYALVVDPMVFVNGPCITTQVWAGVDGHTSAVGTQIVQAKGQAFLNANRLPTRTFAPKILDVGNDFSYLRVGNTWLVQTDVVGFQANGQLGINGLGRITAMEYDDLENTVLVALSMV